MINMFFFCPACFWQGESPLYADENGKAPPIKRGVIIYPIYTPFKPHQAYCPRCGHGFFHDNPFMGGRKKK